MLSAHDRANRRRRSEVRAELEGLGTSRCPSRPSPASARGARCGRAARRQRRDGAPTRRTGRPRDDGDTSAARRRAQRRADRAPRRRGPASRRRSFVATLVRSGLHRPGRQGRAARWRPRACRACRSRSRPGARAVGKLRWASIDRAAGRLSARAHATRRHTRGAKRTATVDASPRAMLDGDSTSGSARELRLGRGPRGRRRERCSQADPCVGPSERSHADRVFGRAPQTVAPRRARARLSRRRKVRLRYEVLRHIEGDAGGGGRDRARRYDERGSRWHVPALAATAGILATTDARRQ